MIINPRRAESDPVLPDTGMILINPAEASAGLRLADSKGGKQHFLYNSKLRVIPATDSRGPYFIAGPSVGSPMAVLTLEKLIALGATHIVVFGWCGSLTSTLLTGDVLLPTWAVSDEGTSAHYPVSSRPESHAPTRQRLSDSLTQEGFKVHHGPVWTTDAPYRENSGRVRELSGQGILGVDMEFAALVTAAAFRKVELTAVLLVSDELSTGTWKPGFKTKAFKKKSVALLHFLADFCADSAYAK